MAKGKKKKGPDRRVFVLPTVNMKRSGVDDWADLDGCEVVTPGELHRRITEGGTADKCAELRGGRLTEAERGEVKGDLPAHRPEGCLKYDIDPTGGDPVPVSDLLERIDGRYALLAYASPSGTGCHLVVPADGLTAENYRATHAFAAAELRIAEACDDLGAKYTDRKSHTDLLYLSHDPDALLNTGALAVAAVDLPPPDPDDEAAQAAGVPAPPEAMKQDLRMLDKLTALEPPRLDDRNLWLEVCCAFRGKYGDHAKGAVREWSRQSAKFSEGDWRAGGAWSSLRTPESRRAGDLTMATLQHRLNYLRQQRGTGSAAIGTVSAGPPTAAAAAPPGDIDVDAEIDALEERLDDAAWRVPRAVPKPELVAGVMAVRGRHSILTGSEGTGKTWFALWMAAQYDGPVLWVDGESTQEIVNARLHNLGVPVDGRVKYIRAEEWAALPDGVRRGYCARRPGLLVVVDSASSTGSGINDDDYRLWDGIYVDPVRSAGCGLLVLEHPPAPAPGAQRETRPRGSGRKAQAADFIAHISGQVGPRSWQGPVRKAAAREHGRKMPPENWSGHWDVHVLKDRHGSIRSRPAHGPAYAVEVATVGRLDHDRSEPLLRISRCEAGAVAGADVRRVIEMLIADGGEMPKSQVASALGLHHTQQAQVFREALATGEVEMRKDRNTHLLRAADPGGR